MQRALPDRARRQREARDDEEAGAKGFVRSPRGARDLDFKTRGDRLGFRKLRGVRLPERKQGLIRYTCLNYSEQPVWMQEKIRRVCDSAGGPYSAALFELMTTYASASAVAQRYFVSESEVYRSRKRFYETWDG